MSSAEKERSRGLYWVIWLVALLPLAYVLSSGPVTRICAESGIHPRAIRGMYAPLEWLHDHTPLAEALDWYVWLWSRK